jgi:ketosteroid isomerase-like protein
MEMPLPGFSGHLNNRRGEEYHADVNPNGRKFRHTRCIGTFGLPGGRRSNMTENKRTVERYMDGFNKSDHEQILLCLTEDVEWEMPGAFHLYGKDAFDKEIENDAFVGSPTITITRMLEENDVVIAEGAVRVEKKAGGFLNAVFCDVFTMKNAKIKRLTTYLAEVKQGK